MHVCDFWWPYLQHARGICLPQNIPVEVGRARMSERKKQEASGRVKLTNRAILMLSILCAGEQNKEILRLQVQSYVVLSF